LGTTAYLYRYRKSFANIFYFLCNFFLMISILNNNRNFVNTLVYQAMMVVFIRLLHSYFVFLLITLNLRNKILYTAKIQCLSTEYCSTVGSVYTYLRVGSLLITLQWLWDAVFINRVLLNCRVCLHLFKGRLIVDNLTVTVRCSVY
jgi:hypothetical protein